ncbi:type II toxin-antitoxin system VapC family toxin [uncultured Thiodictyon sp.]|uniref:type II toxin-antitoxin system VapC family toxin n=1 Tax=uncultured Thiodictyon sp. TaxID=1846217 RepID=UPI0025E847E5|nr:type II toxin-antitoxin system VapC family toxin [uncultured Thiodictyon sp.]
MRLLLDTHIALWALTDDPRLSEQARALINDPANQVMVSAATVWEIAIKHALGRDDMPISGEEALDWFRQAGYDLLPVSPAHAAAVERLPDHHRDPFDRLLVAQAITEPLRLLSRDPLVVRYGEVVIAV